MVVGAKVCELTGGFLWFVCGLYVDYDDYDEACFMHLTPGVVHNFPKAVGV